MQFVLNALKKYSSRPLFKQFTGTAESPAWISYSYATFLNDVERLAGYWARHLDEAGLKPKDVVGIWWG